MIAYKLFRVRKDGSLGSLFINKKEKLPVGIWLEAKNYPTKGYKERMGWHCLLQPKAPHLSIKNRKWYKVEVEPGYITFDRPEYQGGKWVLSNKIKIVKEI